MKLRNTAITLGVGAAYAAGLPLLTVKKEVVIGLTAVVVCSCCCFACSHQFVLSEVMKDSYA